MSNLNPMSGVEHFCDNPECDKHSVMMPVKPEEWWIQHALWHQYKQHGTRHYFSKDYDGLVVGIHLCDPCFIVSTKMMLMVCPESLGQTQERVCFNPNCRWSKVTVQKGISTFKYTEASKLMGVPPSDEDKPLTLKSETKIHEVVRTKWNMTLGGLTYRAYLCGPCNRAYVLFGGEK